MTHTHKLISKMEENCICINVCLVNISQFPYLPPTSSKKLMKKKIYIKLQFNKK